MVQFQKPTWIRCKWRGRRGSMLDLLVKLYDYGESASPEQRYICVVTAADGTVAVGSQQATMDKAIQAIPWWLVDPV